MAAMQIAMPAGAISRRSARAWHARHVPTTVSFPFGLPEPGDYRIFVQVKRSGRVDTGVFDASVP